MVVTGGEDEVDCVWRRNEKTLKENMLGRTHRLAERKYLAERRRDVREL